MTLYIPAIGYISVAFEDESSRYVCGCMDTERCFLGTHGVLFRGQYWIKPYSTDIAAAWQVVERVAFELFDDAGAWEDKDDVNALTLKCLGNTPRSGYAASFLLGIDDYEDWGDTANDFQYSARAETASLAICLAALKIVVATIDTVTNP